MRILLIPSSYPPVIGGLQTVIHDLARSLKAKGYEVEVVTNRYPRSLRASEVLEGVRIHRYLFLTPNIAYLQRGRPDLFLASLYFYPVGLFRLFRLMRSFQPDVVNVHFPDSQTNFILALSKYFKSRLVVSLHGDEIDRYFENNSNSNLDNKKSLVKILKNANVITACSQHLLKRAIRLQKSIETKAHTIHNGVDASLFTTAKSYMHPKPYILGLGRLVFQKGFDLLLESFKQIASEFNNLDLILAGEGTRSQELQEQTQSLGIEKKVHFLGGVNLKKVGQLLKGCECFVVPSRWEPFGIVILEAMVCAKPVIATSSGGPQEIIEDGVNGLLVKNKDTKALASAIQRILTDSDLKKSIALNGVKRVKDFTLTNMVEKYVEVLSKEIKE